MKHLIVGYGEVGQALHKVLGKVDWWDLEKPNALDLQYDVVHICFPYFKNFVKEARWWKENYATSLVIIHSTVPVGTTKQVGAVHSPIRGVHPNLAKGIKTFVKFFGGKDAKKAAAIFEKLGVKTFCTPNSDNTEAAKLWDTTIYGNQILLNKEVYDFCKKYGLSFDVVYNQFGLSYNNGYTALGRSEVVRPVLKYIPGKIGGHCVAPNASLLKSKTAYEIIKYQKGYKNKGK